MKTLTITDESMAGDILYKIALQFEAEYITVKELIEARIKNELQKYAHDKAVFSKSLVQPTELEQRLNGKRTQAIDLEKQLYIAFQAFENNGFILLVDQEQVETLNQKVLVDELTQVSFVKLVPLVGG